MMKIAPAVFTASLITFLVATIVTWKRQDLMQDALKEYMEVQYPSNETVRQLTRQIGDLNERVHVLEHKHVEASILSRDGIQKVPGEVVIRYTGGER